MEIKLEEFDYTKALGQQRSLFIECFPENIGTPVVSNDHYLWKFYGINEEPRSYEYVASINDTIVGYYAAIPYKYKVNDLHVKVGMVCDVMTGIKARGKGIFTKLGKFALEQLNNSGVAFTTGYPIRPEVIPGHKKVGWTFPFELPMYGKFISLNTFLSNKNLKFVYYFVEPFLKSINGLINFFRFKNSETNVEFYQSSEIDKIVGLSDFLESFSKNIPIYLEKNISFLKWRLGAPEKKYDIIVLREKKQIIGYSVSREVVKKDVLCYGVLDFVLIKNHEGKAKFLFREIEKKAKEKKAELILMMMGRKWAAKYRLNRNGYKKTPYNFSFIINILDRSLNKNLLYDENNWKLMWIDSDDL